MGFVKTPEEIARIERSLADAAVRRRAAALGRVPHRPRFRRRSACRRRWSGGRAEDEGDGRALGVELRRRLRRRHDLRHRPLRGRRRRVPAGPVHGRRRADDLRPRPSSASRRRSAPACCCAAGDHFRAWIESRRRQAASSSRGEMDATAVPSRPPATASTSSHGPPPNGRGLRGGRDPDPDADRGQGQRLAHRQRRRSTSTAASRIRSTRSRSPLR